VAEHECLDCCVGYFDLWWVAEVDFVDLDEVDLFWCEGGDVVSLDFGTLWGCGFGWLCGGLDRGALLWFGGGEFFALGEPCVEDFGLWI